jgi:hypothetical protein
MSDEDVAALKLEVAELKASLQTLADAETEREKKSARADVAEAEDDVAEAAKRLGLKPDQYRSAIAAAKRAQFAEEYGDEIDKRVSTIVEKRLQEIIDAAEEVEGEPPPAGEPKGGKPAEPPKAKEPPAAPPKPEGDDPPVKEHWSERPLGRMVGGA